MTTQRLYRGFGVLFDDDESIADWRNSSRDQQAKTLLSMIETHRYDADSWSHHRFGLGRHWSTDDYTAESWANTRSLHNPLAVGVVLAAEHPGEEHVETDDAVREQHGVQVGWGSEAEVTIKPGAPVTVREIWWRVIQDVNEDWIIERVSVRKTAAWNNSPSAIPSTKYGEGYVARGMTFAADEPLTRKIIAGSVTARDILGTLDKSLGIGIWWWPLGNGTTIEDPMMYAEGMGDEHYTVKGMTEWEDPDFEGGEVRLVVVAKSPKRNGEWWDPEKHNEANPLMGNSHLEEGERLEVVEIMYDAGWDWKALPAQGISVTAHKEASYFLHDVNEPLVDTKDMTGFEDKASFDWIHPLIATGGAVRRKSDMRILYRQGVRGVVSGRRDFDDSLLLEGQHLPGMVCLVLPTPDNGEAKPTSWFKTAIDFCLPYLRRGEKVYVHCHAGMNRGPSLAYAVLRAFTGMSHEEAYDHIRSVRPVALVAYAPDADKALVELGYAKAPAEVHTETFRTLTGSKPDRMQAGTITVEPAVIDGREVFIVRDRGYIIAQVGSVEELAEIVPLEQLASKTAIIQNPWDGEYEDGAFPSPRHRTLLSYVIQRAEGGEGFVWGLYSGTSMHELLTGSADSVEQARADAEAAASRGGKEAGKNGDLPEGIVYKRTDADGWRAIDAHLGPVDIIGTIMWATDDSWGDPGEIEQVDVHERYQRRGLATELLRQAREWDPRVHHSTNVTEMGRAWSQHAAGKNGDLPPITFRVREGRGGNSRGLYALDPRGYEMGRLAWHEPGGEIIYVHTAPEWQRRGIATALLAEARALNPNVHHSDDLSPDGEAWSQKVAAPNRLEVFNGTGEKNYESNKPYVVVAMDSPLGSDPMAPNEIKVPIPWDSDLRTSIRKAEDLAERFYREEPYSGWAAKGTGFYLFFGSQKTSRAAGQAKRLGDAWQPIHGKIGYDQAWPEILRLLDRPKDAFAEFCKEIADSQPPGFNLHPLLPKDSDVVTIYRGISLALGQDPTRVDRGSDGGLGSGVGNSWTLDLGTAKAIAERGQAGFSGDNNVFGKPRSIPALPRDPDRALARTRAIVLRAEVDLSKPGFSLLSDGRMYYASEQEVDVATGTQFTMTGWMEAEQIPVDRRKMQQAIDKAKAEMASKGYTLEKYDITYRWPSSWHTVNITRRASRTAARADSVYGKGDIDALFPDGAITTICPWQQAYRTKDGMYDKDAVRAALRDPALRGRLEPVDPRILRGRQPSITRQGVAYYLSDAYRQTGRTFADEGDPGNQVPIIYVRADGTHVIVSGHHRAAAALVKGEPLMALVVREATGAGADLVRHSVAVRGESPGAAQDREGRHGGRGGASDPGRWHRRAAARLLGRGSTGGQPLRGRPDPGGVADLVREDGLARVASVVVRQVFSHPTIDQPGVEAVAAYDGDREVGFLCWVGEGYSGTQRFPDDVGVIGYVHVEPEYRRQGIATQMLRKAREVEPRVHHNREHLSPDGAAWSQHVAGPAGGRIPQGVKARPPFGSDIFKPREVHVGRKAAEDISDLEPDEQAMVRAALMRLERGKDRTIEAKRRPPLVGCFSLDVTDAMRILFFLHTGGWWEVFGVTPDHNYDEIERRMRNVASADWLPTGGMWTRGQPSLDPRIFLGEQMKPEVRETVLGLLDRFWTPRYGEWRKWAKVYLAGSGASHWWDSDGDLDILIGIDMHSLIQARPQNAGLAEADVCAHLDAELKTDLDPTTSAYDFGPPKPMEVTFFVNPGSYDIVRIHPYAAYDITDDGWVVQPPVLPEDWSADSMPPWMIEHCREVADQARRVLALPEPQRTEQGVALFNRLHEWRQEAYAEGNGWLSFGNVVYQWLTQEGLLRALYLLKHPSEVKTAALETKEWAGRTGDRTHITCKQHGTIPTSLIADMPGVMGEVPGEHRNKHGEEWEVFKADVKANGVLEPIFITVDPGQSPRISEGNHRRDAAVEVGLPEVPVEIRYFGHAERTSKVAMPVGPPPPGVRYLATGNHPRGDLTRSYCMLGAVLNGELIGYLTWGIQGRKVQGVWVKPEYRRRRVADIMFDLARQVDPGIIHHPDRTDAGNAWVQSVSPGTPERENNTTEDGYEGGGSARMILERLTNARHPDLVRDLTPMARAAKMASTYTVFVGWGARTPDDPVRALSPDSHGRIVVVEADSDWEARMLAAQMVNSGGTNPITSTLPDGMATSTEILSMVAARGPRTEDPADIAADNAAIYLTGNAPEGSDLVRQFAVTPAATDFFADEADDLSRSYRDLPRVDPEVVPLWQQLGAICEAQAAALRAAYEIIVHDDIDPYETAEQMHADIDNGVYQVTSLHSHHPVWSPQTNVAFRIVHDILGHGVADSDFSLKGEVEAYQAQCKITPEHLWPVLFTEIIAQASYANTHHLFGEQKVGLIPLTQAEIDHHVGLVMDAPDPDYDRLHYSAAQSAHA